MPWKRESQGSRFLFSITGTIIFLNGTSSSGKTTLLRSLQDQLPGPYLDMGIDRFIFMLPKRYLNRPLWDDVLGTAVRAGEAGMVLFSGMHHAIAAAAQQGNDVIADHVLVERAWVQECARLFAGMNAYLIGIQCPLEVLEQREVVPPDIILSSCFKKNNSSSKKRSQPIARRMRSRWPN